MEGAPVQRLVETRPDVRRHSGRQRNIGRESWLRIGKDRLKLREDCPGGRLQFSKPREMLAVEILVSGQERVVQALALVGVDRPPAKPGVGSRAHSDRKSTRLNSSHLVISYAVFCLKTKILFRYLTTTTCSFTR